jgi:hypothetical protein
MFNLITLTSLIYLTYVAFLIGNVQIHGSQLRDVVSKREALYVGGRYMNITASLDCHQFYAYLRLQNRKIQTIQHKLP